MASFEYCFEESCSKTLLQSGRTSQQHPSSALVEVGPSEVRFQTPSSGKKIEIAKPNTGAKKNGYTSAISCASAPRACRGPATACRVEPHRGVAQRSPSDYTVSNLRMAENSSVTADLRGRNIGEDRCSPFALLIWRLANNVVGAIRRHYG
ncbi:hypothetical protein KC347_g91 [Hortaea werneckii]|nr:hypothetical protein KC347_g91 [Hortaea werneckii]